MCVACRVPTSRIAKTHDMAIDLKTCAVRLWALRINAGLDAPGFTYYTVLVGFCDGLGTKARSRRHDLSAEFYEISPCVTANSLHCKTYFAYASFEFQGVADCARMSPQD